jgi:hypothetical protein
MDDTRPSVGVCMGGNGVSVAFDPAVLKMVESEVRTIKTEYRGLLSEQSIDSMADESLQRLAGSRVPQFVPLFVGRFTRQRIKEIVSSTRSDGMIQEEVPAKTTR